MASLEELDDLINAVAAAEANHEPGASRQQRLDAAFNVLDRAADGFWPLLK
ncbi:MAG: hypothetical protein WBH51_11775 [Mycolicibacter algericus]|uniref:hypothetical protein n=1 Tax=Mycolicibacter algericus TaxID=1288388 RepID=UPI003C73C7E8